MKVAWAKNTKGNNNNITYQVCKCTPVLNGFCHIRTILCLFLKIDSSSKFWPLVMHFDAVPAREQRWLSVLLGPVPCLWAGTWVWMIVFVWEDPRLFGCAALPPAPPGSGPWGRVQPVLPELLAGQLVLHHSCTHTTGSLFLCLPNGSCKSRKTVSHMQNSKLCVAAWKGVYFILCWRNFAFFFASSRQNSFALSVLRSTHVMLLTAKISSLMNIKFWPLTSLSWLRCSTSLCTEVCKYMLSKLGCARSTMWGLMTRKAQ